MNPTDIESFMIEDQMQINDFIKGLISSSDKIDQSLLEGVEARLRKHIFIEETLLFPTIEERAKDDVDYLEREHGNILASLDQMKSISIANERREKLSDLYGLLLEHNSYEESFVYDYFRGKSDERIKNVSLPEKWKAKYE